MSVVDKVYRNLRQQLATDISEYSTVYISRETDKILREKDGEAHSYGFQPLDTNIDNNLRKGEVKVK